jgi:hypothetical protein
MCIPNLGNILSKLFFRLSLLTITSISPQHIPVLSKYVINAILHYDIKICTDDTQEFHLKTESAYTENAG